MLEALNISPQAPLVHPHHCLVESRNKDSASIQVHKSASVTAEQNAYHHLPPAAEHPSLFQKTSVAVSAIPVPFPFVIPLVILFVKHTRKLRFFLPAYLQFRFYFILLPLQSSLIFYIALPLGRSGKHTAISERFQTTWSGRYFTHQSELAPLLCHMSFAQGYYLPTHWKPAVNFPIHKLGDTTDLKNYRSIFLALVILKAYETAISEQLRSFFERKGLLRDRQYGFRCCSSTGNLLAFVSWSASLENYQETILVSLDSSKALDQVWHEVLLLKLSAFGLSPFLAWWTSSFISKRAISFWVDRVLLQPFPVNTGNPQGSLLGTTMFYSLMIWQLPLDPIRSSAGNNTLHFLSHRTPAMPTPPIATVASPLYL